jgi:hypothetical protein
VDFLSAHCNVDVAKYCRYTGVALYERLGGAVPVGLMYGAVGGSPIEFWLPVGHVNNSVCGVDEPACDDGGRFPGCYGCNSTAVTPIATITGSTRAMVPTPSLLRLAFVLVSWQLGIS